MIFAIAAMFSAIAAFFDTLNQTIILDAQRRAGDGLSWDIKWCVFPRWVLEWETGLWPSFDARHSYQAASIVTMFLSGVAFAMDLVVWGSSLYWFAPFIWVAFYVPRNLFMHWLLLKGDCPYRLPWYKSIIRRV